VKYKLGQQAIVGKKIMHHRFDIGEKVCIVKVIDDTCYLATNGKNLYSVTNDELKK